MRPAIRFISTRKPCIGVEVGVLNGDNATSILSIGSLEKLYLIDPYEASPENYRDYTREQLIQARKEATQRLEDSRVKWRYSTFKEEVVGEKVDFVYIDGDHSYESVKNDIRIAELITKPGGVIGGHDYYEASNFGVKMAVDEFCVDKPRELHVEGTDWWYIKSPKIFFYNLNVGSGIEKIGNIILGMLDGYNVTEYKMQNPPCILIDELAKVRPDVIIMNEFYPRLIHATYFYKSLFPETKIILVNHTLTMLRALPLDIDKERHFENVSKDGEVLINYAVRNKIDHIINLNWYPYDVGLPDWLERKIKHILFPVKSSEFNIGIPFNQRRKDFLYFGNVLPHKLSLEFLDEFSKTDMTLDIYGKVFDKPELEEYNRIIEKSQNINYLGFCPNDKVHEVMNSYRFFISARDGHEPFMTVMAEAIMSGMIPLIANDRTKRGAEWIDHYVGCYLEYQSLSELLEMMKYYLKKKGDNEFIITLTERASENSVEMTKRTSCEEFKVVLLNIITQTSMR